MGVLFLSRFSGRLAESEGKFGQFWQANVDEVGQNAEAVPVIKFMSLI